MERAVVVAITFVLLLKISIEYKPFFLKSHQGEPLAAATLFSRLSEMLTGLSETRHTVLLCALGVKHRLRKLLKQLEGLCGYESDISFILDDLKQTCNGISTVIGKCTDEISVKRYPARNGVPRIYSICTQIAEHFHGVLSHDYIERIKRTTEKSDLCECEKKSVLHVLALCFCDIALYRVSRAIEVAKEYYRGYADGKAGKIDLLSIEKSAYSTGALFVFDENGKTEYSELASNNGIDIEERKDRFFRELAAVFADAECACRSAQAAVSVRPTLPSYPIRPFGGETEYKQNSMSNPAVSVSTDNRGKTEIKAYGQTIPVEVICECANEKISLASCDGIMSNGRTVYHAARDYFELTAEFTVPTDICAHAMRISLVNRKDETITVKLSLKYGVSAERIDGDGKSLVYRRGGDHIGIYCDEDIFGATETVGNNYILRPFEKKSFTVAVVFGRKYTVSVKGMLTLGCGAFERSVLACGAYSRLSGLNISSDEYDVMRGVEYYRATDTAKYPENADVDVEYGNTGSGYRAARRSGLCNVASDGEYHIKCFADGTSLSRCAKESVCDKLYIALENDGHVFSPTGFPCGGGKASVEFKNGVTTYFTSNRGFDCTLERFIARGKNAERITLTIKNRSEKARSVFAMASAVLSGSAEFFKTDTAVTAMRDNGQTVTVAAASAVSHYSFYAEGYFNHGEIDRASSFRSGGVLPAPTVSVRVDILPQCTKTVDFAIISSMATPSGELLESVLAFGASQEKTLTERGSGIYIIPMTSNDTLNRVYSRAQYLALSGGIGEFNNVSLRGDSFAAEMLRASERLYDRGKYDSAQRALFSAITEADDTAILYRDGVCFFAARLIYKLVTENLFGFSARGDTARISPKIYNAPIAVSYEIVSSSNRTEVNIDCTEKQGDWLIKQGRITRTGGALLLSDGGSVTVERSGEKRQGLILDAENPL